MLGGATGATQPLGRGETGPSSLASSGQTLAGVEAPVWGSVQAPGPPSSVSKQRCDGCPEAAPCPPPSLAMGWRGPGSQALLPQCLWLDHMTGGTWVPFVGGVGSGTHWTPFSASLTGAVARGTGPFPLQAHGELAQSPWARVSPWASVPEAMLVGRSCRGRLGSGLVGHGSPHGGLCSAPHPGSATGPSPVGRSLSSAAPQVPTCPAGLSSVCDSQAL